MSRLFLDQSKGSRKAARFGCGLTALLREYLSCGTENSVYSKCRAGIINATRERTGPRSDPKLRFQNGPVNFVGFETRQLCGIFETRQLCGIPDQAEGATASGKCNCGVAELVSILELPVLQSRGCGHKLAQVQAGPEPSRFRRRCRGAQNNLRSSLDRRLP